MTERAKLILIVAAAAWLATVLVAYLGVPVYAKTALEYGDSPGLLGNMHITAMRDNLITVASAGFLAAVLVATHLRPDPPRARRR